jgi:hypothetical protein
MAARLQRSGAAMAVALGLFAMAAAVGGFAAGFHARANLDTVASGDMSAADTVNLRFPNDLAEAPSSPPIASAPVALAFASADSTLPLFDPTPTYPMSSANAAETPTSATIAAAEARMQLAAFTKPGASASRNQRSNAVLNDSQIASIKRRLSLTPEQERYWPAVAAELRKMEYKKDHKSGAQTASVDMSRVNVEGLKSAGFPLVMSFNDDQKRELKSLAHLLGLENVLSTF